MYVCTLTAHLPCPSLPRELKPEESWAQYLRPNNVKFTCFALKNIFIQKYLKPTISHKCLQQKQVIINVS